MRPPGRAFYNAGKTPLTIDLGSRQYLDLDQQPVLGSLTLQPFTSKILVDNGPAPLTLLSIQPAIFDVTEAADFTLQRERRRLYGRQRGALEWQRPPDHLRQLHPPDRHDLRRGCVRRRGLPGHRPRSAACARRERDRAQDLPGCGGAVRDRSTAGQEMIVGFPGSVT